MTTLTHIAVHVADLEKIKNFYSEFCGLKVVHERNDSDTHVIWMAEYGRENELIFVFFNNGAERPINEKDYSHIGFACESREEVDEIAEKAKTRKALVWPPREEPFPVGYYCGVKDPNGVILEFSYGQPLGPGSRTSITQDHI